MYRYSFLLLVLLGISSFAQVQSSQQPPLNSINLWSDNSSFDGVQGQAFVLMHNRKGIRIEYNIHRKKIELWTSPLAGKSIKSDDRNFSNRDDFTKIFDQISFPQLSYKDFVKCDYDAFHSVLHFKDNKLHIYSLYDKPAVLLWFEQASFIDLKTDKQDVLLRANDQYLLTRHPDRGKMLGFGAAIASGGGRFTHQQTADPSRSFYARANLDPNQVLILAGDDFSENIQGLLADLVNKNISELKTKDSIKINAALENGTIAVRNNSDLQKLIDVNKKVLLSMSDESGAIRAALRYIYYLIWHRDGAMINSFCAYTGWSWPLEKWTEFELSNPTIEKKGDKTDRYFGQLVSEKITKREEDGPFYGIWSAFTNYTQSGEKSWTDQKYLTVLEDNIAWWENNFYDSERQLFGRYYYCESSMYGSIDDGFDNATGNPTSKNISRYKGDTIVKAFDLYFNNIVYTSYLMLSAMEKEKKSEEYLLKAKKLGEKLNKFYSGAALPSYGDLISVKGKTIAAQAFGMDDTDYIWGMSVPFFYHNQHTQQAIVSKIYDEQMRKPKGHFFAGWFSNVAAMDPEMNDPQKMIKAIEYVVPQCVKPGACLPMPYAIAEIVDVEDCSIYHDVRPQAFSISAFFASISNLGVRRLPFGLAVRGTDYLNRISKYQYQKKTIDFIFKGDGNAIKEIKVNGKSLTNSYQIPEESLSQGQNTIEVSTSKVANTRPVLIGSTMKLKKMIGSEFQFEAFGKNVVMIKNGAKLIVKNSDGQIVPSKRNEQDKVSYFEFEGKGFFSIYL